MLAIVSDKGIFKVLERPVRLNVGDMARPGVRTDTATHIELLPFHAVEYFGIVVRINGKTRVFYGNDMVHQVFCVDGRTRYFVGSEMKLIYR